MRKKSAAQMVADQLAGENARLRKDLATATDCLDRARLRIRFYEDFQKAQQQIEELLKVVQSQKEFVTTFVGTKAQEYLRRIEALELRVLNLDKRLKAHSDLHGKEGRRKPRVR